MVARRLHSEKVGRQGDRDKHCSIVDITPDRERWFRYQRHRLQKEVESWVLDNQLVVENPPPWRDEPGAHVVRHEQDVR